MVEDKIKGDKSAIKQRVFMKGVGTARPQFRPAGVQESGDEAVPTPAIRLHAYALAIKSHRAPEFYLRERAVYERLTGAGVSDILGFHVPQFIRAFLD